MSDTPTATRLHIFSEVIPGRPVQMLRCGTFEDSYGRSATFTRERLDEMCASYQQRRNKRLPITERHDFGRAVGRITALRRVEDSLYGDVAWNKYGQELLRDEVYNAFSSEVAMPDEGPWQMLGGSLTNYPAVDGMEAVVLEAPQPEPNPASEPARAGLDIDAPPLPAPLPLTTENTMNENEEGRAPEPVPVPTPALEPPSQEQLVAAMTAAFGTNMTETMTAQMTALFRQQMEQQIAYAREQAQQAAAQQIAAFQAEQRVRQYSQDATTATLQRQHALPCTADELTGLLLETPASVRPKWQALLDKINTSGLVPFEEIGSAGDNDRSEKEQFDAAVQAKVAGGMSTYSAMKEVARLHPEWAAAYNGNGRSN